MNKTKNMILKVGALMLMACSVYAQSKAPDIRTAQAIEHYKQALAEYTRDNRGNGAQCVYWKDTIIISHELNNFLVKRKMVPLSVLDTRTIAGRCKKLNRKYTRICWDDSIEWNCIERELKRIIPYNQIHGLNACSVHDGNKFCWVPRR